MPADGRERLAVGYAMGCRGLHLYGTGLRKRGVMQRITSGLPTRYMAARPWGQAATL